MSQAANRPMNVTLRRGSRAEAMYVRAGQLAPGLPATPAHDLKYRGGRTIPKLTYRNLFVGSKASWSETDFKQINDALAAAMTDSRLNGVIQQYFNGPITTAFAGAEFLPGKRPHLVTQASIEKTVKRLFKDGKFGQADFANTVFNFMLPSGTVLADDDPPAAGAAHQLDPDVPVEEDASSLAGLGGYHGSVHAPSAGGLQKIYYAVGAFSEILPNGEENGIVAFPDPWQNVVATFYHELNEARTDPDVEDVIRGLADDSALGWTSNQGEECGDFPVFESGKKLNEVFVEVKLQNGSTVPVQLQYSNRDHGPSSG